MTFDDAPQIQAMAAAAKNDDYKLRRERILGAFSLRYRPTDWLR